MCFRFHNRLAISRLKFVIPGQRAALAPEPSPLGRNGGPRHLAGDLGLFVVRHPGEDFRQDLPRLGKRRLAMWIVRAPHHVPGVNRVFVTFIDSGSTLRGETSVAVKTQ